MTNGSVSLSVFLANLECACVLTLVNKAVKLCNMQFIYALTTSNNEMQSDNLVSILLKIKENVVTA